MQEVNISDNILLLWKRQIKYIICCSSSVQDVFVSFCTPEFSLSVPCANAWSQKLNGFDFPQWKVLVCCISPVSSCQNTLLFILPLKDCPEKINFYPWEKKNFFLFFSQFVCKLFLMNTGKDKIILKGAMNEKGLDQFSSLALADTPFISSHHTWSKNLRIWITTPHQTLSPLNWINTEQLLIHLYLQQHNPLSLIPQSSFFSPQLCLLQSYPLTSQISASFCGSLRNIQKILDIRY